MANADAGHSGKLLGKIFSNKEVAYYLNVHEKIVYSLVAEKGLLATKVTGKWIFPQNLVEKWLLNNTANVPYDDIPLLSDKALIITGSPDILLDRLINIYNGQNKDALAAFGNTGSAESLEALNDHLCHIAIVHDLEDENATKIKSPRHQSEPRTGTVRINFERFYPPSNPNGSVAWFTSTITCSGRRTARQKSAEVVSAIRLCYSGFDAY